MAEYVLDVTELDDYAHRLRQISGAGALAFTGITTKYADLTMQEARRLAPVDTGHLQGSIQRATTEAANTAVTAGWRVGASYAMPVEYGFNHYRNGYIPAQPYVRPALKKYRKDWTETLAQAAKRQFSTRLGLSRPQLGSVPSLVNTPDTPNRS